MAKKSMIARDVKREKTIAKFAVVRRALKKVISSPDSSYEEKQASIVQLSKQPRNASQARLQRRCNQCGRPHAVYRKFALCRICLRNILMMGQVPGGRKSSW